MVYWQFSFDNAFNTIDSNGVAVYVLTSRIGVLVFMIYISFSRATMTLISQCFGAKEYHAIPMMGYLLFTIYPKSMNVLIGHGIRALGKTSWMLYTQIAGTVFVITVSYVLVNFFDLGLEAIFITILCDEGFRSVLNTCYFIYQTRTKRIMNHQVL